MRSDPRAFFFVCNALRGVAEAANTAACLHCGRSRLNRGCCVPPAKPCTGCPTRSSAAACSRSRSSGLGIYGCRSRRCSSCRHMRGTGTTRPMTTGSRSGRRSSNVPRRTRRNRGTVLRRWCACGSARGRSASLSRTPTSGVAQERANARRRSWTQRTIYDVVPAENPARHRVGLCRRRRSK